MQGVLIPTPMYRMGGVQREKRALSIKRQSVKSLKCWDVIEQR